MDATVDKIVDSADLMLQTLETIYKELEDDTNRLLNSNRRGDQSLGTTLAFCRKEAKKAIDKVRSNGK